MTDRLLLVGVLTDEDVQKLLVMIDPETWDETFDRGKAVTTKISITFLTNSLNSLQKEKTNIVKAC